MSSAPAINFKRLMIVFCAALLLTLLCALPAWADYDPIKITQSCTPKSLTGPQEVTVTIRVVSVADADLTDPVKLFDPNGNACTSFGSNGSATLKQGAAVTYTGTWKVTDNEFKEGKIRYHVSYTMYDDDGNPKPTQKVIAVPIQKASVAAKLNADYTIKPEAANKGQTVTITYTLSNVGNVDVTSVQITNANVHEKKINIGSIPAGEKVVKSIEVVMGSKALKSSPRVTYKAAGSDRVVTINNMKKKTIEVAKSKMNINLTSTAKDGEAMPGTKVTLKCTISNNGNLTYSNITISDANLGEIAKDLTLKGNGSLTHETEVTIDQSAEYAFVVKGQDSTGAEFELSSNAIPIKMIDVSKLLQLELEASASTLLVYERPALVDFTLRVKNVGLIPGTDVEILHGKTVVATFAQLAPGEQKIIAIPAEIAMEGQFKFLAQGKDEAGQLSKAIEAPIVQISYLEPTPAPPPPTEQPTEPPLETEPPEALPANAGGGEPGEEGIGMTLLYIMAALLIAALVTLLAIIFLGRRRQARPAGLADGGAYDSLELGSSRRDYSGRTANRGASARMAAESRRREEGDELPPLAAEDERNTGRVPRQHRSTRTYDHAEEPFGAEELAEQFGQPQSRDMSGTGRYARTTAPADPQGFEEALRISREQFEQSIDRAYNRSNRRPLDDGEMLDGRSGRTRAVRFSSNEGTGEHVPLDGSTGRTRAMRPSSSDEPDEDLPVYGNDEPYRRR